MGFFSLMSKCVCFSRPPMQMRLLSRVGQSFRCEPFLATGSLGVRAANSSGAWATEQLRCGLTLPLPCLGVPGPHLLCNFNCCILDISTPHTLLNICTHTLTVTLGYGGVRWDGLGEGRSTCCSSIVPTTCRTLNTHTPKSTFTMEQMGHVGMWDIQGELVVCRAVAV